MESLSTLPICGIFNEKGEGKIRLRARTEIEKGDAGRTNIVITEIPYTISGNKLKLVESLAALAKDKVFDEIYDVRDESSKEGIRIVVEVKKGRDIDNLLNGLYKKSQMEDTYGVNLLAIRPTENGTGQPKVFNLKSLTRNLFYSKRICIQEMYSSFWKRQKTSGNR